MPSLYKNMLSAMNYKDRETPANEISTQGIDIFDTKTDTGSQSLLDLGLKLQGLYYECLQTAMITNSTRSMVVAL